MGQTKNKPSESGSNDLFSTFTSLFSSFGLENLFVTLHIAIQSTDPEKAASYTIQYSSGERESYLQDGLVAHYKLDANSPKIPVKFYYQNYDESNHVYAFLGAANSKSLSSLEISIYSMSD